MFYMIDEDQLKKLKAISSRLHTEERMNGNEMRDLGHTLELIVRICKEIPIPENKTK